MPLIVPPIKCQGIKTKLLPAIRSIAPTRIKGRWIEPFCGSGVVLFNIAPERAVVSDTNRHIIRFYNELQTGSINAGIIGDYLKENGERLKRCGEDVYYEIRDSFNQDGNPLSFLFLNRSCFNGVMRFNRKGGFNVPFCRKPRRFARAYITKIVNQVKTCATLLRSNDWKFKNNGFHETLAGTNKDDVVYSDPPYAGRHVDYFNSWSEKDESVLAAMLKSLSCAFILSTWYKNKYRTNPLVESQWNEPRFTINTLEHFYHVGSKERLRHSMLEAIVTNYSSRLRTTKKATPATLFSDLELGETLV